MEDTSETYLDGELANPTVQLAARSRVEVMAPTDN